MTILNSLSPNLTLYDLQKLRYEYGQIAATPKKGVALTPPKYTFKLCVYMFLIQLDHLNHLQQSKLMDLSLHAQSQPATRV